MRSAHGLRLLAKPQCGQEMRFVQQTYTGDVLYGDRFKVPGSWRFRSFSQEEGNDSDYTFGIAW